MRKIKVTLKKSPIDKIKRHKLTLKALGLTKIGQSRIFPDNKALRGMINQIAFMLQIEDAGETAAAEDSVKAKALKEITRNETQ